MAAGERALRGAFERVVAGHARCAGRAAPADGLAPPVLQSLRCAIDEAAVIGPGTGRWPGIDAWVLPLGSRGHVIGAVRIEPAPAADELGREHAAALASVLAQGLWRLRAAEASLQAAGRPAAPAAAEHLSRRRVARPAHAAGGDRRRRLGAAGAARAAAGGRAGAHAGEHRRPGALSLAASPRTRCSSCVSRPGRWRRGWNGNRSRRSSAASSAGCAHEPCGARIEARVEAALPLVRGDATLLAQLLTNLLDNACKYSDGADPAERLPRTGRRRRERGGPRPRRRAARTRRACSSRSFAARRRRPGKAPASASRSAAPSPRRTAARSPSPAAAMAAAASP